MVVERYIGYLAVGITNLVNLFQPEIICIGGGISLAGAALLEPLKTDCGGRRLRQGQQCPH